VAFIGKCFCFCSSWATESEYVATDKTKRILFLCIKSCSIKRKVAPLKPFSHSLSLSFTPFSISPTPLLYFLSLFSLNFFFVLCFFTPFFLSFSLHSFYLLHFLVIFVFFNFSFSLPYLSLSVFVSLLFHCLLILSLPFFLLNIPSLCLSFLSLFVCVLKSGSLSSGLPSLIVRIFMDLTFPHKKERWSQSYKRTKRQDNRFEKQAKLLEEIKGLCYWSISGS